MRVVLIRPPTRNMIKTEVPAAVGEQMGVLPPLGLMYLQTSLAARTEHEAVIIDAELDDLSEEALAQRVLALEPGLVGVTSHTHNLVDAVNVIRELKDAAAEIPVCLGGSHANAFPLESLELPGVDYVAIGEGEETLCELTDSLAAGRRAPEGVEGLLYKSNGQVVGTPRARVIKDVESLPIPDRRAIEHHRYHYVVGDEAIVSSIISARGCPYNCSFCSTPKGAFRSRSAESVLEELEQCVELGIKEIYFVDDTFNVSTERVERICDEIVRRGLEVKWSIRARINKTTEQMLEKAKAAGCTRIQFGVETSTDEGMEVLRKGITVEQVRQVFKLTRKVGVKSAAYFMIGCPHERTREDVLRTIDFALELDPDFAMFGVFSPYPDTELYRRALDEGVLPADCWREYALAPDSSFLQPFWEEHLPRDELLELVNLAFKRFYLRPRYVIRNLFNLSSPGDLWRKAKAGLKIFGL